MAPYIRALAMIRSCPVKRTGKQARMLFSKTVVHLLAHTPLVGGTLQPVGWIPSWIKNEERPIVDHILRENAQHCSFDLRR